MLKQIREIIEKASGAQNFSVAFTEHDGFGHVTANVAMATAKDLKRNPKELADEICNKLASFGIFKKVEVAGPGFINFTLTDEFILSNVKDVKNIKSEYEGKKVLVEYTDPNPFKVFHIGHLMTNTIGEAMARLYEAGGAEVKRVNYQGDVGRHIAINIWAILNSLDEFEDLDASGKTIREKVEWLGQKYAEGYKAFEGDVDGGEVKLAVADINKKIYEKSDTRINEIYEAGRKWSLDYFEELYKMLGTKFDTYIFESEVASRGAELVKDNTTPQGKCVFEVGDGGAVIYDGEKKGLHKRVFLNQNGLPTYEAKDLGNAEMKIERLGEFDKSIVITGNEQTDYFKVLYSAINDLGLVDLNKMEHKGHGMMRFTNGKMSSRSGNVIAGEDLINDVKDVLKDKFLSSRIDNESEKESVLTATAIASIKYSILKQETGRDVIFDFDKAISVEGDSGPYLQYSYARLFSVAQNTGEGVVVNENNRSLVFTLSKFESVLEEAVSQTAPQKLCSYLIELARAANSWYAAEKISGSKSNEQLAYNVCSNLGQGLKILGIVAPNRM